VAAFDSDGVRIAFDDEGEGPPVVLVHGFAASRVTNWKLAGWYRRLRQAGRRVVALDCRGHGESEKPHEAEDYGVANMGGDVVRLMDHLGIERADLSGYSMGGIISTWLLTNAADRFNCVVLAGIGGGMMRAEASANSNIADTLAAPGRMEGASAAARGFRAFAKSQGGDLLALSACMRALHGAVDPAKLAKVSKPVLLVVGEKDDLIGDPRTVGDAIPGAELVLIPGADHLTAVPHELYKAAVLRFLDEHGGR
jgi:pimeloyl-ACP methyl ester carboxylesterase